MDGNRYLSIGAMAAANGITPRALRVYQQKGLVEPAYVDEQTGNRYYDIHQSRQVDMVHALQNIGFSLDEIADVARSASLEDMCERTQAHLDVIKERQHRLALARVAAEGLLESCRQYASVDLYDQIVLERFPERHIIVFEIPRERRLEHTSTEARTEWEWTLRSIKRTIQRRGYPPELFRQVSTAVPYENVLAGVPQVTYAYVPVDPSFGPCFDDATAVPGGMYLSIYGTEAYLPDGTAVGARTMQRVLDYARAKRFVPSGDFYEEVICRWPTLFGNDGKMLYRLSLPVRREEAAH